MADEGTQPLSGAEAQLLEAQQAQQAAEAQTGTQPIARTAATQDPTVVDPRFDRVSVFFLAPLYGERRSR